MKKITRKKKIQKIADLNFTAIGGGPDIGIVDDVDIDVSVHEDLITQNIIVIKDKIINIGIVPTTITLTFTGESGTNTQVRQENIPFQAVTAFPGVCPEDKVTESPLKVEAVIAQAILEQVLEPGNPESFVLFTIIVKVILRTTITVTQTVIKSKYGWLIDINKDLCKKQLDSTIQPPTLSVADTTEPTSPNYDTDNKKM